MKTIYLFDVLFVNRDIPMKSYKARLLESEIDSYIEDIRNENKHLFIDYVRYHEATNN